MIFFVTKNPDTFNNPTMYGIFSVLEEKKIKSVLICNKNVFSSPFKYNEIIYFNTQFPKGRNFKQKCLYIKSKFRLRMLKCKASTIVGIDPDGLVLAASLNDHYFENRPLDYISFEIFFRREIGKNEKEKEIKVSQKVRNIVIQDSLRAKILFKENLFPNSAKIFYIPVSPFIKLDQLPSLSESKFREKHNVKAGSKIIISFGTLDVWSGANDIFKLLNDSILPTNFVFVIHSRFPLSEKNFIHQKFIEYSKKNDNLILSNEYIGSFAESVDFLKQFDYGFAFYNADGRKYTGDNIYNIGLASGKFSMYMKAGLPTFTNNLPFYESLNCKYNFGMTFKSVLDFKSIKNIKEEDYRNYQINCSRLFEELLDPTEGITKYIDSII